jgi:hypothetical protein
MNYETNFEKLQKLKEDLYSKNLQLNYKENKTEFKVDAFSVKKRSYIEIDSEINKLVLNLEKLNVELFSMKKMYIYSRSDVFENTIRRLIKEINQDIEKIASLKNEKFNDKVYIQVGEIVDNANIVVEEEVVKKPKKKNEKKVIEIKEKDVKEDTKKKDKNKDPEKKVKEVIEIKEKEDKIDSKKDEKDKEISPQKAKNIKSFLFKTYEQCVSQKSKEPTFMTKADIVKHIKENDRALLEHLPKSFQNMKKDEICKVIFQS